LLRFFTGSGCLAFLIGNRRSSGRFIGNRRSSGQFVGNGRSSGRFIGNGRRRLFLHRLLGNSGTFLFLLPFFLTFIFIFSTTILTLFLKK
jgi:hypothetical protein